MRIFQTGSLKKNQTHKNKGSILGTLFNAQFPSKKIWSAFMRSKALFRPTFKSLVAILNLMTKIFQTYKTWISHSLMLISKRRQKRKAGFIAQSQSEKVARLHKNTQETISII